jgi:hypothetical protein
MYFHQVYMPSANLAHSSLVPCGHIACLGCLQQWFKTNVGEEDGRASPIPIIRGKKTCPHCRTKVVQRPVAAFLIKEALSTLETVLPVDPSTRPEPVLAAGEDLWKDIFPSERDGAGREADGAFIDHDDGGVRRCQNCLYEIFQGTCVHCGEEYDMSDGDSNDADDYLEEARLLRDRVIWGGINVDISDDEDQDQYESDFINDENLDVYNQHRHRHLVHHLEPYDHDSDSDNDYVGHLYGHIEHPPVVEHINITDADTDDDDDIHQAPLLDIRQGRRGHALIVEVTDEEDENDEGATMTVDVDDESTNLGSDGGHNHEYMNHELENLWMDSDEEEEAVIHSHPQNTYRDMFGEE